VQTGATQLIGRDSNGKFKHHENYLQLKNKINAQEKSHQDMFDTINEKLNDETFLQQAIKVTSTGEGEDAAKSASEATSAEAGDITSKAPDGMTKADEECYTKRYGDIPKNMTGRMHYQEVGSDQGRLPSCARNLTEYEAQRYIDNSPVL